VQRLYDLIQPPDEDAFFDEIDALEEEGWLTIRNGRGDDDDLLFPVEDGSLPAPEPAGRAAAATAAYLCRHGRAGKARRRGCGRHCRGGSDRRRRREREPSCGAV